MLQAGRDTMLFYFNKEGGGGRKCIMIFGLLYGVIYEAVLLIMRALWVLTCEILLCIYFRSAGLSIALGYGIGVPVYLRPRLVCIRGCRWGEKCACFWAIEIFMRLSACGIFKLCILEK